MLRKVLVASLILAVTFSFAAKFGAWTVLDYPIYDPLFGNCYMAYCMPTYFTTSEQIRLYVMATGYGMALVLSHPTADLSRYNGATVSLQYVLSNKEYTVWTIKNVLFDISGATLLTTDKLFVATQYYVNDTTFNNVVALFLSRGIPQIKITTGTRTYVLRYSTNGFKEALQYILYLILR